MYNTRVWGRTSHTHAAEHKNENRLNRAGSKEKYATTNGGTCIKIITLYHVLQFTRIAAFSYFLNPFLKKNNQDDTLPI